LISGVTREGEHNPARRVGRGDLQTLLIWIIWLVIIIWVVLISVLSNTFYEFIIFHVSLKAFFLKVVQNIKGGPLYFFGAGGGANL
jgi:hypothetical protein